MTEHARQLTSVRMQTSGQSISLPVRPKATLVFRVFQFLLLFHSRTSVSRRIKTVCRARLVP